MLCSEAHEGLWHAWHVAPTCLLQLYFFPPVFQHGCCAALLLAMYCLHIASRVVLLGRLPALKRQLQQLPSLSQNLYVLNVR